MKKKWFTALAAQAALFYSTLVGVCQRPPLPPEGNQSVTHEAPSPSANSLGMSIKFIATGAKADGVTRRVARRFWRSCFPRFRRIRTRTNGLGLLLVMRLRGSTPTAPRKPAWQWDPGYHEQTRTCDDHSGLSDAPCLQRRLPRATRAHHRSRTLPHLSAE